MCSIIQDLQPSVFACHVCTTFLCKYNYSIFLLIFGKCIATEYDSEKCGSCFISFAWMCSLWKKYVTQYLLYNLIYDDLNACMDMVYDF